LYQKVHFQHNLSLKKYNLPVGASLHIIGRKESSTPYIGAFNNVNNPIKGEVFATGPLPGDSFVLEYFEPKNAKFSGELELEHVMHAYKNIFGDEEVKNGRSGLCNFNVVCPLGDGWRNQIRSVAALTTGSGGRFCTASLLNNLKNDKKQYLLTAHHCGSSVSGWVAVFHYQSSTCERGGPRLLNHTVGRVSEVFRNPVSDHNLVLIGEEIPRAWAVYYNGWSAVDQVNRNFSVGIHHPAGDVKKFHFHISQHNQVNGQEVNQIHIGEYHNGLMEQQNQVHQDHLYLIQIKELLVNYMVDQLHVE